MTTQQNDNLFRPATIEAVGEFYPSRRLNSAIHNAASYANIDPRKILFAPISEPEMEGGKRNNMQTSSVSKLEFWLGIAGVIIGFMAIVGTASWTISNNINDKISQSRQEISANIQMSKSEISSRVDRIEDKVDSGFKDTSQGIMDLKLLLNNNQHQEKKN
ncbi:Uncharacterised protein [Yersinia rohdei]|uniref:hypothetical protein n=1 Tax=Yersinia rohdei TaxID=29485 RepID=UPI0005DB3CB3|nr:hypothetical protein [Yersinia rohdei]CNJ37208.1 Uncharacterised protein [Yersinia rohdei]